MSSTLLEQVAQAWITAGTELGIVVQPFAVELDGEVHRAVAYLLHFGGPNGMIVDAAADEDLVQHYEDGALGREAKRLGFYYSLLNAEVYSEFDREKFIEALSDWGYFGDERPDWLC